MTETQDEAAFSWNTLKVIVFVVGVGVPVFSAGVWIGEARNSGKTINDLEGRVGAQIMHAESTYVRKDGAELADIKAQVRAMNDKLDYLIRMQGR